MAIYKLGDICRVLNGSTPSTTNKNYWDSGTIPFIKRDNLISKNPRKYLVNEVYFEHNQRHKEPLLLSGVLVSANTTLEVTYKSSGTFFKQDIFLLIPDSSILLDRYLFFWMKSKSKEVFKKYSTRNSLFRVLNSSNIKNILIDVPTLNKQKEIIDIIEPKFHLFEKYPHHFSLSSKKEAKDSLEKLIDIIEPLDCIEKTLEKLQRRILKVLGIKILDISTLNGGIKNRKIKELFNFPSTSIQIDEKDRGEDGYEYFTGTELSKEESSIRVDSQTVSSNFKIKRKLSIPNDIFIQKVRYIKIKRIRESALHNQSIINFRPKRELNPEYLYLFLLSLKEKIQKEFFFFGTKMPEFNWKEFKEVSFNMPSVEVQELYSNMVNYLELISDVLIKTRELKHKSLELLL